jgi:hypothetical protein
LTDGKRLLEVCDKFGMRYQCRDVMSGKLEQVNVGQVSEQGRKEWRPVIPLSDEAMPGTRSAALSGSSTTWIGGS